MLGNFQLASYKMFRIQSKEGARTFGKSHNFMKALDGFSWREISSIILGMGSSCRTCGKHWSSIQATLHLRFISVTRGWLWRQTHLHLLKILMELKDADSSNFCPSSKSDWPKKRVKKHEGNCQSYDINIHKLHQKCEPSTDFVVCLFVFLHLPLLPVLPQRFVCFASHPRAEKWLAIGHLVQQHLLQRQRSPLRLASTSTASPAS